MNGIRRQIVVGIVLILALVPWVTGCDIANVGLEEKTRAVVEEAIEELGRQPGRWGAVLNGAIDELGDVGGQLAREIRAEVQSLYAQSLQTTQEAAFCSADFIGLRVRQELQAILHDHFPGADAPEYIPVICTIDPTVIQSDRTTQVSYSGFDFSTFRQDGDFTADLVYDDNGQVIRTNFGGVNVLTNYRIVVDIQGFDLGSLNGSRHPQLVMRWDGRSTEGRSEVPINIVPTPTPKPPPLPTCQWTNWVSEETGAAVCPDGFAMRGVACNHDYCDNMSLYCCPYRHTADPTRRGGWSRWFSEEGRSDGRNRVTSGTEFVYALQCKGKYCDSVSLWMMTSSFLANAGQCGFIQAVSEEGSGKTQCQDGQFVAGMECTGEYCDNVSLYCCRANY